MAMYIIPLIQKGAKGIEDIWNKQTVNNGFPRTVKWGWAEEFSVFTIYISNWVI